MPGHLGLVCAAPQTLCFSHGDFALEDEKSWVCCEGSEQQKGETLGRKSGEKREAAQFQSQCIPPAQVLGLKDFN